MWQDEIKAMMRWFQLNYFAPKEVSCCRLETTTGGVACGKEVQKGRTTSRNHRSKVEGRRNLLGNRSKNGVEPRRSPWETCVEDCL